MWQFPEPCWLTVWLGRGLAQGPWLAEPGVRPTATQPQAKAKESRTVTPSQSPFAQLQGQKSRVGLITHSCLPRSSDPHWTAAPEKWQQALFAHLGQCVFFF